MNAFLTAQIARGDHVDNNANSTTEQRLGGVIGWRTWIGALLQKIDDTLTGGLTAAPPVPVVRTPAIATATDSTGSPVVAGKKSVEFIFTSDFVGSILGVAFTGAADSSQLIEAPAGDTLDAIAYTVTAGSARIVTVT